MTPKQQDEARHQSRHQVQTSVFFMVTKDEIPLSFDQHNMEGEVVDLSQKGFRFKSPMPLEKNEQISFEITSDKKTIFSGVAQIMHSDNDLSIGAKYLKIKQH